MGPLLTFFRQIAKCVDAGHLLSVDGRPELPESFIDQTPKSDARLSFITGGLNNCFLPESQRRTFEYFERIAPGRHSLHVVPGYGHLDVFVGKNTDKDWFPLIINELDRPA